MNQNWLTPETTVVVNMFSNEPLAYHEYLRTIAPATTPEQRLQLAVLWGALDDVRLTREIALTSRTDWQALRARRIYRDAVDWLIEPVATHAFAFVAICECWGLHADWLRRGILDGAMLGKGPSLTDRVVAVLQREDRDWGIQEIADALPHEPLDRIRATIQNALKAHYPRIATGAQRGAYRAITTRDGAGFTPLDGSNSPQDRR